MSQEGSLDAFVSAEFKGLQAQITSLSQHLWRNGLAYQQLHEQWQQSCRRASEANTKLGETRELMQAQEIRQTLQIQELGLTKDSLSHEFRLLEQNEEKIRLQSETIQKLVVTLNKLVSPDEMTTYYGVLLPDDFGLGTMLKTNQDLQHQASASQHRIEDLERRIQDKEVYISGLQREQEKTFSELQSKDSEIGALRQELSQYCNEGEVEFGTAVLGKRKRLQ
ncbi:MAG: hypothetical protein Q9209_003745 [Squamulea sp. 1 TL-2023]